MRLSAQIVGLGLFVGMIWSCSSLAGRGLALDDPWEKVTTPSVGKQGPIGFYSAGCLDGAVSLPQDGLGFQVMRLQRNRFYGHRDLIDFITRLGARSMEQKIGVLLMGDLSQPRGGPMIGGHASHQIGLDVDIWYWLQPDAQFRSLTPEERETLSAVSLVDLDRGELIRKNWRPEHAQMLELAATLPGVQRIFVHAAIKKELCETTDPTHREWLHQLRPWFGHDDHFHVRLRCPVGALNCQAQDDAPAGDGCGELAWWLSTEARDKQKTASAVAPTMPQLPELCAGLL